MDFDPDRQYLIIARSVADAIHWLRDAGYDRRPPNVHIAGGEHGLQNVQPDEVLYVSGWTQRRDLIPMRAGIAALQAGRPVAERNVFFA